MFCADNVPEVVLAFSSTLYWMFFWSFMGLVRCFISSGSYVLAVLTELYTDARLVSLSSSDLLIISRK